MSKLRRAAAACLLGFVLGGAPPHAGAQEYKIPDSLARYGLPRDPGDVPRFVVTRDLPVYHVFKAGCPSGGGWAAAAFAALEEAAETDSMVRWKLAGSVGARVLSGDMCTSDVPRFEAWLAGLLRRQWNDGALGDEANDADFWPLALMSYISLSEDPASRALVRDIAMDSAVTGTWRSQAARTMVTQLYGEDLGGKDLVTETRYQDAVRLVLADLASGPPLTEFANQMQEWLGRLQVEREREEALRVARLEGWARPEIPRPCYDRFVPAMRISRGSYVSELRNRYYPDEMKGLGIGGTTTVRRCRTATCRRAVWPCALCFFGRSRRSRSSTRRRAPCACPRARSRPCHADPGSPCPRRSSRRRSRGSGPR